MDRQDIVEEESDDEAVQITGEKIDLTNESNEKMFEIVNLVTEEQKDPEDEKVHNTNVELDAQDVGEAEKLEEPEPLEIPLLQTEDIAGEGNYEQLLQQPIPDTGVQGQEEKSFEEQDFSVPSAEQNFGIEPSIEEQVFGQQHHTQAEGFPEELSIEEQVFGKEPLEAASELQSFTDPRLAPTDPRAASELQTFIDPRLSLSDPRLAAQEEQVSDLAGLDELVSFGNETLPQSENTEMDELSEDRMTLALPTFTDTPINLNTGPAELEIPETDPTEEAPSSVKVQTEADLAEEYANTFVNDPNNELLPKEIVHGAETCGVCMYPEAYPQNQIIYCDGCDLAVHQHCYGVSKIPEGDWYCRACQKQIDLRKGTLPAKASFWGLTKGCVVCKTSPKGLKWALTDCENRHNGRYDFCHIICAQYLSEIWFKEPFEKVQNVQNIQDSRKTGTCSICGVRAGAKLLCSLWSCRQSFHATCGISHGCVLEDVAGAQERYARRVVYCLDHRPCVLDRSLDSKLKHELNQSREKGSKMNRNALGWNWQGTQAISRVDREHQHRKKAQQQLRRKQERDRARKLERERVLQMKRQKKLRAQKRARAKVTLIVKSDSETESDELELPPRGTKIYGQRIKSVKKKKTNRTQLATMAARKFASRGQGGTGADTPAATMATMAAKKFASRGQGGFGASQMKRKREPDIISIGSGKRKKMKGHEGHAKKTLIPKREAHAVKVPRLEEFSSKSKPHSSHRRAFDRDRDRDHRDRDRDFRDRDRDREYRRDRDRERDYKKRDLIRSERERSSRDPRTRSPKKRSYDDSDGTPTNRPSYTDVDVVPENSYSIETPAPQPTFSAPVLAARRAPPPPPPTNPAASAPTTSFVDPRQQMAQQRIPVARPIPTFNPSPYTTVARLPPPMPTTPGYGIPIIRTGQMNFWEGQLSKSQASDQFSIRLKYVAGEQITSLPLPNNEALPSKGRIKFQSLTHHLPLMCGSTRKKLTLAEVHPRTDDNSSTQNYNKFCQYYRELKRGAVVDLEKKHGVTMYIMPVEDGMQTETKEQVLKCFGQVPPPGVMWAIIIQFPETQQTLVGQRTQPKAMEIKTRIGTTVVNDPRNRADPRLRDPRAEEASAGSNEVVADDVLKALDQLAGEF